MARGFILQIDSWVGAGELEWAQVTDYLIDIDQKIPGWLIKIMFLGEVKRAIRSDIKFWFDIMGFSISDTIFLFNSSLSLKCSFPGYYGRVGSLSFTSWPQGHLLRETFCDY